MSERRTCKWCTFFSAMEGESHCNICKPLIEEQARRKQELEDRSWDFDSREDALELLACAIRSEAEASDWNEQSDAQRAIDKAEQWLQLHPEPETTVE